MRRHLSIAALAACLVFTPAACAQAAPDAAPGVSEIEAAASPFAGDWLGVLDVGAAQLRLQLILEEAEDGLAATLISLDQGGQRIPASDVTVEGDAITVVIAAAAIEMRLTRTLDGMLDGSFHQGGASFPLTLARVEGEAPEAAAGPGATAFEAPPPVGTDREVSVSSGDVTLTGSLRLPDGEGPFPAVLLLNGSGGQDRDATIMGRPLFAVLASALAERGIASLRLDDRGMGGSSPVTPESPADLAADAAAAMAVLRSDAATDAACIGAVGHSEGGLIAFLAADAAEPHFILTLAGMTGTMRQTLYEQAEAIARAAGADDAAIAAQRVIQDVVMDAMSSAAPGEAPAAIEAALIAAGLPAAQAAQQGAIWGQPYAIAALDLDGDAAAAAYDGPVHAIFAERDLQVLPEANADRVRAARGGAPTEVTIIPGVNHLFQAAETGLMNEYATSPHAMAPEALAVIADAAEGLIAQGCR